MANQAEKRLNALVQNECYDDKAYEGPAGLSTVDYHHNMRQLTVANPETAGERYSFYCTRCLLIVDSDGNAS